jgi:hypothetical protein
MPRKLDMSVRAQANGTANGIGHRDRDLIVVSFEIFETSIPPKDLVKSQRWRRRLHAV